MNPSTVALAEASPEKYHYSQELAPNEVVWLALGLPVQPVGLNSMHHLNLKIADSLIFGFGQSGILLKTDSNGMVSRREITLEECLRVPNENGIVAYEKETFMKQIPPRGDAVADKYSFEGVYTTVLRSKQYLALISQTFQRITHAQRMFRIQYHVKFRHHKVHKYAYNRVIYKAFEKTHVLSIHSVADAVVSEEEVERDRKSRDKPWLQKTTTDLAKLQNRQVTYESIARKQKIVSAKQLRAQDASSAGGDAALLMFSDDVGRDVSSGKRGSKVDMKRSLKTFNPDKVIVREVTVSAASELLGLTKDVATHLSLVFHKQVTSLTLDFVKDMEGRPVLIEICGFEFSDYEKASGRVMPLHSRVKVLLENYYRFRFGGKDGDDDLEMFSGGSRSLLERANPHEAGQDYAIDFRTPQTVMCRLCKSRINNNDTRYCMTSVMIQSTVMHMRARLHPSEWPDFCRDRSYTLKSMQRADDALSSKSQPRVDATEVNLYVCELCYKIYKQETRLIEVEHKLAIFTRSVESVKATQDQLPAEEEASTPIPAMDTGPARRTSMSSWARPSTAPSSVASSVASLQHTPKNTLRSTGGSALASITGSTSNGSAVVKESEIRDLFRAKNAPSRLPSGDYFKINFSNKSKPESTAPTSARADDGNGAKDAPKAPNDKPQKKNSKKKIDSRPTYPKHTIMPRGRRVARSDMMTLDLTLCRLMIAIQKISDLPVPFFDVYEGFRVCYYILGMRNDAPCKKSLTFARNRVNRFVNPDVHRAMAVDAIMEGEEDSDSNSDSDSDSNSASKSGSSNGSSVCSSKSDTNEGDEEDRDSDSEGNKDYSMTRRASKMVMQAESAAAKSVASGRAGSTSTSEGGEMVVGALDVKFMKMTHFMVHGNAMEDGLPAYNDFLYDNGKIMVVLCAKLKDRAVIDERHWNMPDMSLSKEAKSAQLRRNLIDIKQEFDQKMGRGKAYSHLSHLSRGTRRVIAAAGLEYDPRKHIHKVTDTGDPLPEDALAYCYLPLDQFKSNAVKRLDLGAPMTYAIRHLPKERSVPMLRAMVGIDRPVYPMDNWSLPFSMVHLEKEGNVYVPEVADQYCAPTPLPKEWLNIELERSAHRRVGFGPGQVSESNDMAAQLSLMAQSQKTIDIDSGRRAVPTLHVSAGRIERITMIIQNTPKKVEDKVDNEQRLERMDCSVWCLCVQVMQARHVCNTDEIFADETPYWQCKYSVLGDNVSVSGMLSTEDIEEGVVSFGALSKHMVRGSVDALEAMFADMDPITFTITRAEPPEDILNAQRLAAQTVTTSRPTLRMARGSSVRALLRKSATIATDSKCSGHHSLQDIHQNRFAEVTVQLARDSPVSSRRDKMYPPYVSVNLKLFRMGPREPGNWLPQQTALGDQVYRYVHKVVPVESSQKQGEGL